MKKILLVILLQVFSMSFSQVQLGKNSIDNSSVSLEFGNVVGDSSKQLGIILPWVTSQNSVSPVVLGTIIFDSNDKKVKYYKYDEGTAFNIWFDLSVDNTGTVNTSQQAALNENSTAKVVIGSNAETDTTPGILVLSDNDKAMVLPLVDKYSAVVNPSAGMMVYDLANNMFCVFNGTVWTFWKS